MGEHRHKKKMTLGHKNMELNILKAIKQLRQQLRHKPKDMVEKKIVKKTKPIVKKAKPIARNKTIVIIDGVELSLSQIAKRYNLELATVRARYRVGNRGKLLIRPSNRSKSWLDKGSVSCYNVVIDRSSRY